MWRQPVWYQSVRRQAVWCQCACAASICMMSSCVMSSCVMSICVMSICVMSSCVMSSCVMSICVMSSCVTSIFVMSICVVSICVISICVMSICVTSIFVMSICAMSSYVMSVCVCVMSICVVSVCVMSTCVMSICVISICVMSTCVMSICVMSSCVTSIFVMSICAMSSCVMSVCVRVMSICAVSVCVMSICVMPICVHSYPKRNLHTARRQTRMPARHPHKIFAPPIGTATPNAIYTQQGAKPACQQDIHAKFSHLLLAQLPRTQFTHSKAPNPHASKTSTQTFRTSYWHSYPECNLHTARRQTRMPGRHQHAKAAAERRSPNDAKAYIWPPERRRPNDAKAYIRSPADAPSPTPATQKQRQQTTPKRTSDPLQTRQVPRLPRKSSGRAAETKRRQSVHQTPCRCSKSHACHAKAAAERRRPNDAKAYIRPTADAPSPTPATQKQRQSRGDQTTPKRTSDPLRMLQVPRLPRKSSDRAAETKRRQSVHQTPCRCTKPHACHAKAAAERRRPNDAKAYIRPPADAPSPTPATQKQRQSGGDQTTPKRTSDPLQMLQAPRLPHSDRAAETKRRQSVHQTPCRCSKSHTCHAKATAERRRPNDAKAYIGPTADAPSPTPATQKQRQSGGDQTTPKRTSDMHQVPRLPRKSSGRAAETKRRQSVHQIPCRCPKPHACHAKAAAERRRPNDAKAYIRPHCRRPKSHACHAKAAAERRRPNDAKAYIGPTADAPSPTPATQKQRQSGGDQTTPKRTSDPLQMHQVPRLPRKSSSRAAETKRCQSVHQTPCRCPMSHACHAKAATEPRRPNDAKAYIGPTADAPSPTPATQKQRQSRRDQTTPKRTSDPLQVHQVPRLPRKSSGRAAETKRRQSVHQTPCRCTKSHACHAKAAAERRRPNDAKAYIRPPADAPSPTPATQKQRQSGGDQTTPKRTSDPLQMLQVPRLPRKSSDRAAETKRRQSVHQTPCRCSKSPCHACQSSCVMSTYVMSSCVMSSSVMSSCVMSTYVMSSCVMSTCVMSTCVMCVILLCVCCSVCWCVFVCVCCVVWDRGGRGGRRRRKVPTKKQEPHMSMWGTK